VLREHLFQRVLYATDFSGERRAGLRRVLLPPARDPGGDARPRPVAEGPGRRGPRRSTRRPRVDARRVGHCNRDPGPPGRSGRRILAVEDEVTPTTTLVGSRGRSRLRRLMLGSVSEEIVARADGNVYLVPPPRTA